MQLNGSVVGEGKPVVILHGLFGAGRNWGMIGRQLAQDYQIWSLDLRNHGDSPHASTMTYEEMAEDVADFIETQALDDAAVIGHSMGGKTAMTLALTYPDLVERLMVVDIAPVVYQHELGSYAQAMRDIDVANIKRRADVEALLKDAVPVQGIRLFLLQNLVPENGGFRWRLNLDAIIDQMPAISGFPSFDDDQRFEGQTTFYYGSESNYVTDSAHGPIEKLFPNHRFEVMEGAGHWLHADKPEEFARVALNFLGA